MTTPTRGAPGALIAVMWGAFGSCLVALCSCSSFVCGLLVGPPLLIVSPFVAWWLWGRILLAAARLQPGQHRRRGILIRSESPHWSERIASGWLPVMGEHVQVLNWSERAKWTNTVPVLIWKHFCGHYARAGTFRDFNPALIVFRGLRHPLVFRCYPVFRAAARGDPLPLEAMEKEMFRALGV